MITMQGYVLLKKAQTAYDDRDALRMLTLTQAALTAPWQLPIRVRAEATQQEARGLAMLGEPTSLIEQKLDDARRLLDDAAPDDGQPTQLGRHYNSSLLTMQTAICYTTSQRTVQELCKVLVTLKPWAHRAAVRELREAVLS